MPARYADLTGLLAALADHAAGAGVDALHIHRLQLAVEELFTNTIQHGLGGESALPVVVGLSADGRSATLRYRDLAPPFDLTVAAALAHDHDRIGGFGLNVLRSMATAIRYRYCDGANHTELDFEF